MAGAALGVEPEERLEDDALEARARVISKQVRCMVCDNQSIDDSATDLAKELRLVVRERLVAGDTNAEVFTYIESRYGEFALLKPKMSGRNLVLWLLPLLGLVGGGAIAYYFIKKQKHAQVETLSQEEEARLKALLEE